MYCGDDRAQRFPLRIDVRRSTAFKVTELKPVDGTSVDVTVETDRKNTPMERTGAPTGIGSVLNSKGKGNSTCFMATKFQTKLLTKSKSS